MLTNNPGKELEATKMLQEKLKVFKILHMYQEAIGKLKIALNQHWEPWEGEESSGHN